MFYDKIIKNYQNRYYKRFIRKSLRRVLLFIYFKQLIYINKSKFNNSYLQGLTNLVKKIYKKNVQFNFINVKYFYINSDIFTQSLILKLRKNRRKLLKYLKSCISKINIKNIEEVNSKYFFNLININSSIYGRPSALLRGSFRPNLQFTKLNSKTRIGSFGIKG